MLTSYLIWAADADTWLHVTTSSIQISQLSPLPSPLSNFGYGSSSSCYMGTELCVEFTRGPDVYQIMNNESDTDQVLTSTQNEFRFSFLAPVKTPPDLDFTTSSIAVSSSCLTLSRQCQLGFYPPWH